jgi:hypothetical protein
MRADPNQSAAALFARPAAANRAIFYAPDGSPRSLAGVMEVISGKLGRALDRTGNGQPPRLARADYSPPPPAAATPYLIVDEAVFSPAITTGSAASPPPHIPVRMPMSQVLGTAFGNDTSTAPAQVRRAYDRLKAFGL